MNPDQSSLIWVPIACKNISRLEEQTTRLCIYSNALQTRLFFFQFVTGRLSDGYKYESRHDISNNEVCVTSTASDQPAHSAV